LLLLLLLLLLQVLEWLVGGTNTSSSSRGDESSAALAAAARAWDGVIVFDECHKAKNFAPGKEAQSTKARGGGRRKGRGAV
jgi:hypothetical protein